MILEYLMSKRDAMLAEEVRREKEEHPLVYHIERRLNQFFTPSGGLSCPELERNIRDAIRRDRNGFYMVLGAIIDEYRRKRPFSKGRGKGRPVAVGG